MREFGEVKRGVIRLFLMVLLCVAGSNVVIAQVTASMSGTVDDPAGAAVPGANVTVTSLETGASRTITADEGGKYQVLSLPVGRYEVKAEKTGFKAEVQTGINLVVGQQAVVNLRLEVGAVREQVTVTSDAPLINTTTSSISGLVGEQQVKELPLNGRSFDLLILLNPGTTNITSTRGTQGGNLYMGGNWFSVAGRRPVENLTLMNGVEYTGAGTITAGPAGASQQLLGVDAVREYNVLSDTYGAEYGQRAGAQVSVVTQSGTNQLHGTLFEFLRNSKLDARNFFDHGTIPAFKRNQFGGALGGPIRKDKTFLFGNYEGFRQRLGLSNVSFVPDANARLGLLPCGSGGVTCVAGTPLGTPTTVPNLDKHILPYLNNYWPVANGPNLGGGIAESFTNPEEKVREDFATARLDQRFSDKDSLFGAYTITDGFSLDPGPDPLFGFGITMRNQVFSLQETHIFSPQVVNTATAGYSRANYMSTSTTLADVPASLNFVTGLPPGAITIGNLNTSSGWTQPGFGNPFSHYIRNLFTYMDGIQVIKGRHQISAGVWFKRIQNNDNDPLRGDGQVSFGTITSFMQGTVGTFTVAPVTISNGWRSWQGAWYVQDSIQLRPNLTVRVGLRHEFSNGMSEATGRAETELFVNGVIQTLPRISNNLLTENNSKWLFSPRVGLAWDPFGKGKTSIRAGFGTYYDLADWLVYFVDTTPPLNGAASYSGVSLFSIIPINASTPLAPPCSAGVPITQCTTYLPKSVQSNYKIPTVESWNFSVEQQLAPATSLRVAYYGSHNYHQWLTIDPNTIPPQICSNSAGCVSGGINAARGLAPQGTMYIPVTPTRPNPFLGSGMFAQTDGYGNYNSLQVEVTQRVKRGLQFRASYAWSKNMDISSALTGAAAHPLVDPNQDYGLSALSVGKKASGNLSYELPFGQGKPLLNGIHGVADKLISGWQLNSIVTLQSGYPLTLTTGGNQSGNGDSNGSDRPTWNPAFTGTLITGTPTQWFNPNAFILPTPGTFGNVGRGVFVGPGLVDLDFSLLKNTRVSERIRLQFRAEVFNSLNHANFSRPSTAVFSGSAISPVAGVISGTETTSRQIQFGLKLIF